MAVTSSTLLPLGTRLPTFALEDTVTGQVVTHETAIGRSGLLVAFICNHCPFVVHLRNELVRVAHAAIAEGFGVVAINANSIESHPQDGPEHMKVLAQGEGFKFPFLFDATQEVAKAFTAACTPDLFLFDASGSLVYRGQFDDSRPGNEKPVTGADLRAAIAAVVKSVPVSSDQKPSIGCNIKWK